jgi:triosephosphate isomerase (TIM)
MTSPRPSRTSSAASPSSSESTPTERSSSTGTSTRSAPARSGSGSPPPPTDRPDLGAPILVVNLKVYPAGLGDGAELLARELETAGRDRGVAVAIAPPLPDVGRVARAVGIPVLAQHVDPAGAGARTGFVPPEAIRAAGARGSLVNHSERPLSSDGVRAAVEQLAAAGLAALVCAPDAATCRRFAEFRPPYIAVEPPELISGRVAVSTARPELIVHSVAAVRQVDPAIRVLCGAGVHGKKDVARALELGSRGVLVSSAVATAPSPRAVLEDLLSGF